MIKNFAHLQVVEFARIFEALTTKKSIKEICSLNIKVITELKEQSEYTLNKYSPKWGTNLIWLYERKIHLFNSLHNIHVAIMDESFTINSIKDYLLEAEELYDLVLGEYTEMYPTFENADEQEKTRLVEEIFAPVYLLYKFLERVQKTASTEEIKNAITSILNQFSTKAIFLKDSYTGKFHFESLYQLSGSKLNYKPQKVYQIYLAFNLNDELITASSDTNKLPKITSLEFSEILQNKFDKPVFLQKIRIDRDRNDFDESSNPDAMAFLSLDKIGLWQGIMFYFFI